MATTPTMFLASLLDGATALSWSPRSTPVLPLGGRIALDNPLHQPSKTTADEAWIQRVQGGDEDAAAALVERLYPTIIKSVRCHRPRRTSEEDLVQSIFVKIFTKLHQFSGQVPLEHWVSRIAINTCLNQFQYEAVRPELRMADLTEEEQAVVEHLISTNEDLPSTRTNDARELLERLLSHLSASYRLVITLLHLEERSVHEVSHITGWSASLVKVKAFRARRQMRKVWTSLANSERC